MVAGHARFPTHNPSRGTDAARLQELMNSHDWEHEYEEILAEAEARGEVQILPQGEEKRRHPRFPAAGATVTIREDAVYRMIDLSRSGLAFHCSHSFPVGHTLTLALRDVIAIEAEVVGCEMEERDATYMEYAYKVRCRFLDDESGLRFLVLVKELERGDQEIAVSC